MQGVFDRVGWLALCVLACACGGESTASAPRPGPIAASGAGGDAGSPGAGSGGGGVGGTGGGASGGAGMGVGGTTGGSSAGSSGGSAGMTAPGTPGVEICRERRDLIDFVWSSEDSRRLECNVEAVGDAIFGLSFEECVADAEQCMREGQAAADPPVYDCEVLAGDGSIDDEQRSEANDLLDQCFLEWMAIIDGIKMTASCETLVEDPLAVAGAAVTVGLLVSAPDVLQPESCREYNEKYGGNGGGGDID